MNRRSKRLVAAVLAASLFTGPGAADGTWLGDSYCQAAPNSTGVSALIRMFGPDHAGSGAVFLDDSVILSAGPVPDATIGLFIYGQLEAQLPFGDGFLCISGQVHRLPVTTGRGFGGAKLNQSLVFSDYPGFAPGDWKFQAWYRDALGGPSGFNLSDGLSVLLGG